MLPGTEITDVVLDILPDSHLDGVFAHLPVPSPIRQHDLLTVLPLNILRVHQQRGRDGRVYSFRQQVIRLGYTCWLTG